MYSDFLIANVLPSFVQVNNATARVMTKKTAVVPTLPNGKTSYIHECLYIYFCRIFLESLSNKFHSKYAHGICTWLKLAWRALFMETIMIVGVARLNAMLASDFVENKGEKSELFY